jgi:hypothetical protein
LYMSVELLGCSQMLMASSTVQLISCSIVLWSPLTCHFGIIVCLQAPSCWCNGLDHLVHTPYCPGHLPLISTDVLSLQLEHAQFICWTSLETCWSSYRWSACRVQEPLLTVFPPLWIGPKSWVKSRVDVFLMCWVSPRALSGSCVVITHQLSSEDLAFFLWCVVVLLACM